MIVIDRAFKEVKDRLYASKRPVALTGAGVSAESGVPTFRGIGGLWRNFRAEELATPEAFKRDFRLVWEWYDWRRRKISVVKPNSAHYWLADIEKRNKDFILITQNVDGLHGLAGSRNLLEIHGSIWKVKCVECKVLRELMDVPVKMPPMCACGGLLRPAVVWFGEALPEETIQAAFDAADKADFMMVIGTSGAVQPAASLASRAKRNGACLVEINPETTPLSRIMDLTLDSTACRAAGIMGGP